MCVYVCVVCVLCVCCVCVMRFCSPCASVCVCFVHVSIISFVVVYELLALIVQAVVVVTTAVVVNSYELMVLCLLSCLLAAEISSNRNSYFTLLMAIKDGDQGLNGQNSVRKLRKKVAWLLRRMARKP